MKNLVVIFGGESCEHDISIITGEQLIANANEYLYNIIPVYIDKNGVWYTGKSLKDIDNLNDNISSAKKCAILPHDDYLYINKFGKYKRFVKIDCVIICMHGLRGEDGCIAGLLDMNKIPYSSVDILGSSVCMDKTAFKIFCQGLNISVVEGFSIDISEFRLNSETVCDKIMNFGLPVIIKPSRLGSSIGIEVCENVEDLNIKLENSFKYDNKVLIERYVNVQKEVNIALIKNKGDILYSNTEEPLSKDKILSFDEKYRKNSGGFETIKRIVPAQITDKQYNDIKNFSTLIYNSLNLFGVVRFDFIIDNNDTVFVNEVNTIPGSMANYLFDKDALSYSKLIDMLISNALHRKNEDNKLNKVLDTGVLKEGVTFLKK